MAGFAHFLRGILVPLFIALVLYLSATLFILPFVRRHRTRYSQYLPMPTSMATHAADWRTKLSDALYNLFMPSTWSRQPAIHVHTDDDDESSDFDDEEGEGMVGFDPVDQRRREALEQRRSMVQEERRLGRELEQGFKDDSEDESVDETRRQKIDAERDAQLKLKRDEEERKKRLRRFDMSWIKDALLGSRVPPILDLELAQRAVVRGIRHNDGFAAELHGTDPRFTRALNAQAIMNNRIPDMYEPNEFPYCIWHPKTPSQDTCRALLRRYPQMNYQIGRVCAVAGYTDLYQSLSLLPEVHIAEEARDNVNFDMYTAITSQPVKYAVFNDYTRTYTPSSPRPSLINGDTCVRSMLEIKQHYSAPDAVKSNVTSRYRCEGFTKRHFNITEDMSIDTYNVSAPETDQSVVAPLLYNPLPLDLPTVQKDVLILMAALRGDIDRYARLRRPYRIKKEAACLVRGIYHSSMFAKWVSLQHDAGDERFNVVRVKKALHARFVMCNNIERITPDTDECELPYIIWYPQLAQPDTYVKLAKKRPDMRPQAARACIVAGWEDSYREIDPPWDRALAREADRSSNPFYAQDLRAKAETARVEYEGYERDEKASWREYVEPWKYQTLKEKRLQRPASPEPQGCIDWNLITADTGEFGVGEYDGLRVDGDDFVADIFANEEEREKAREIVAEHKKQWPMHREVPWVIC
ncbi:hypothetical protein E8E12_005706 [Didymella heteroderae]|uniref:Uncharacterized protein n=1 Tax=Didymella heteroderae TaxID=1769908 RepID=A0A9P5BXL6_9PLEO|nr:hypothetical protein E8E12_005706 [Didymella heteroderae]